MEKYFWDPISSLPLRPSLREHWPIIRQHYRRISYILLDLKDCCLVNAFYGYTTGDNILKYVGKVLKDFFEDDLDFPNVYRFDSDIFIIVTGIKSSEVYARLSKLQQYLNLHPFQMPDNRSFSISFVAVILEIDLFHLDPEDALWIAERALLELKQVSRHGVRIISHDWIQELKSKLSSLKIFIKALEKERVLFAVQNIVDLLSNEIYAREVLARIKLDNGKIVPAAFFINDLFHLGLEMELDEVVIDKALRYKKRNNVHDRFSLNVSNKFFDQKTDWLLELVEYYHINPEEIIIELTERDDFAKISAFEEKIAKLKEAGFLIFLDDFGMGYANFHLLEKYSFDGIKIDGQFIRNMISNPLDRKFVRFILELTADLGIKMVAEYVESEDVIKFLRDLCEKDQKVCLLGQGYVLGQPEIPDRLG